MYEIYCRIRDRKGMRDADIARIANIPKSTFSDWKSGRGTPKTEKMKKIADALGVPVDYLMTGDAKYLYFAYMKEVEASAEEMQLINAFRKADDLTQQMILRLLGLEKDGSLDASKEA